MFKTRSGAWTWTFVEEGLWRELAPAPETLRESDELVKRNPVREVFRRGACFIKVERPAKKFGLSALKSFFRPKAEKEFEAARALAESGVPVVEALGYGKGPGAQALVTRAVEGAVPCSEFDFASNPDALERWAFFVRDFASSGFFHPDFHNGNILRRASDGAFLLVDVYGVEKNPEAASERRDSMLRIVLEMRRGLAPGRLIEVASACGVSEPERFIEDGLDEENLKLLDSWEKRKAQLLSGYGKYVKARGASPEGRELMLFDAGADLSGASIEDGEISLLKSFRLELAGLPHRRSLAWDAAAGKVYFEPLEPEPAPGSDEVAEIAFYARHFGIDAAKCLFGRDAKGALSIIDFESGGDL